MLYIWLKDIPDIQQEEWFKAALPRQQFGRGIKQEELTGRYFVDIYEDPLDPTATPKLPRVPSECIDAVTYRTRIERGLRTEGIYVLGSATIYIKTGIRTLSDAYEEKEAAYQDVHASSASLEDLRKALISLRRGELMPDSDFERPQLTLAAFELRPSRPGLNH